MTLEQRIHHAESDLFDGIGIEADESFLSLAPAVRVSDCCHTAAVPRWFCYTACRSARPRGRRCCPLPAGTGCSRSTFPATGCRTRCVIDVVRFAAHARELIDDIFDALGTRRRAGRRALAGWDARAVVRGRRLRAGSRGWSRSESRRSRIPGARVRMPLSLLTVRGLGRAVLRSPSPRPVYRRLLAQGLGRAEVAAAPDPLIDALRLSARRPGNASSVSSLMHAIDHFRRPRPESVLDHRGACRDRAPTMFIWGADAPYLTRRSRPTLDRADPGRDASTRCPAATARGSSTPTAARS